MTGTAAERLQELIASLADSYQVVRELGSGGMATVFLAEDRKHNRQVALKVLHPDLASVLGPERFRREIEIAAGLQHPHILTVFNSGEHGGLLWFTMPFVDGESLRDLMDREHEVNIDKAIRIVTHVANALDYAHSRGVVHRDIKPENILLAGDHALVADFGIARVISDESQRLTSTGLVIGTPAYMSPEQGTGDREIDARSDIYSLASVAFEMMTGEPPYASGSARAMMVKRMTDPVPSARRLRSAIPVSVDDAIMRALSPTPADRFAYAGEFAAALVAAPSTQRNWLKIYGARAAAIGMTAVVVLLIGLYLWGNGAEAASPADEHNQRGVSLLATRTPESVGAAVTEFEAALALDSANAEAHANIGYALTLHVDWGWSYRDLSAVEMRARAIQHTQRAIELDSSSAVVWLARAYVLVANDPYRVSGSLDAFSRALALDSGNAEAWYQYGQAVMILGQFDEAAKAYRRAFTLDPNRPMAYMSLSALSMREGRVQEARGLIDSAVLASKTVTSPYVRVVRGLVALAEGDVRTARDEAELALTIDSVFTLPARSLLIKVLVAEGNRAGAMAQLDSAQREVGSGDVVSPTDARYLASALVSLGRTSQALDVIEQSRPRGAALWFYLQSKEFDSVREEPRFQRVYREADPR